MTEPADPAEITEPIEANEVAPPEKSADKVDWLGELRGLVWMLLAVLAFHSFIAKPFYIPSISLASTGSADSTVSAGSVTICGPR